MLTTNKIIVNLSIIQYDFEHSSESENKEFERLDSEFENFKNFEVFNRKETGQSELC